jgi:NAD-dependent dihydropyrimidine dehydrogenase PreA subunit
MKEGMNKIVVIDEFLCIGCAKCVDLCPKKILCIDKTT